MTKWCSFKLSVILLFLWLPICLHAQTLDQTYISYHNPLNSGNTCTGTTLSAAITAIGAAQKTMYLTKTTVNKVNCTWIVTSDLTIPVNIKLWIPFGTVLQVQTGATLTFISDPLIDNPESITGGGTVVFLAPHNQTSQSYALSDCWTPKPVSGVTLSGFACTARIRHGERGWDIKQDSLAVGPLNQGDGTYWIAMNWNSGTPAPGWVQQASSRYLWRFGVTKPVTQPGVMIFMIVIVTGGNITDVGDLREDDDNDRETNADRALWGVVGDNSTDDTVALQRVINSVLWKDTRSLVIPHARGGNCYAVTRLYFNWDATNNPGAPRTANQQGRLMVRGYGQATERDMLDGNYPVTCIRSLDTVGPLITVSQCPTCSGVLGNKRVDIESIHFEGNTTEPIVLLNETSQLNFKNISIKQNSLTGRGIAVLDVFQFSWHTGYIMGPGEFLGTGIGVHMDNPDNNQAGNIEYSAVSSRNFRTCWQYGNDGPSDNIFTTIVYKQIQGKGCVYAMNHLEQARAVKVDASYFETFNHGPAFSGLTRALTFTSNNVGGGQVVAGGANLRIGDDRWTGQKSATATTVQGNNFNNVPVGTYGIHKLVIDDDDMGTVISTNNFIGAGVYIHLQGFGNMRSLIIMANRFGASTTPITSVASERPDLMVQFSHIALGRIIYTYLSDLVSLTNASTVIPIGTAGNNVRISVTGGPATITSISLTDTVSTAIPAGTVVRLFLVPGSSNLTLVNGAALHLEANTDKTLTPGDSLQMMQFDSSWWQVSPLILTTP